MVWPSPRVLGALLARFGALLGLCVWLAMLAGCERACNACFHCMNAQCCAGIQHGMVYGIAYEETGLALASAGSDLMAKP